MDPLKRPRSRWREGQTAGGNAILHQPIVGSRVGSPGSSYRKSIFFSILQTSQLLHGEKLMEMSGIPNRGVRRKPVVGELK